MGLWDSTEIQINSNNIIISHISKSSHHHHGKSKGTWPACKASVTQIDLWQGDLDEYSVNVHHWQFCHGTEAFDAHMIASHGAAVLGHTIQEFIGLPA